MVIQVIDVLTSVAASILPNLGFWSGTYLYKEYFSCWYFPPKFEAESAILTMLNAGADVPYLKDEVIDLFAKYEELRKKSGSMEKDAQEQICRYAEELVKIHHELDEKKKQLHIGDKYKDSVQASGVVHIPKIFWVLTAANNVMGMASYLVWKSYDAFYPLACYASLLLLYWTYYPVLFSVGWKKLSAGHAGVTGMVSGVTTFLFWSRSKTAGVLMVPFLGVFTFVFFDIFRVSQGRADVRRYLSSRASTPVPAITIHIASVRNPS